MSIRLNDRITASGQISADDVADIAAQGFKAIITVRPDGEMPGQASQSDIAAKAAEAGLAYAFIPVTPGVPPSLEDAKAFAAAVGADSPAFAYCGAGPRVILLASLAAASEGVAADTIIAEARNAGFDVSGALPLLQQFGAA
ncbi:MAG: TIGR01244 family phosphatase [Parvularculaceae bacterium]|nr:TIGR01244 family phosphatase [Parvularculaceae bacterium]